MSVFNDNVLAPSRQGDKPGRSARYSGLEFPLLDGEGIELPAFDALAKEVQWESQKVKEFEDVLGV